MLQPRADQKSSDEITRDVQRLQIEANENLLLAGIRAQEQAADAIQAKSNAEREVAEAKVREDELRAAAQFRERLIGIVGHDLRNPLNAMVMASGQLVARGTLTDDDARLASRIVTSGQRMSRMIAQLVDFTRASLGAGFELELSSTNLGDICRDVAEELSVGTSTEIRTTLAGDLDGVWDADRLAEAISNIVGNAVDHARQGSPVRVDVRGDDDSVVVEVSNRGASIPPETMPTLFTAFRRGEARASKAGHLGLGLYIASEIVRAHGGTIEARSTAETTAFALRLPRDSSARGSSSKS